MQELAFHHARLRSDCQSIASASGPSAWRTRLENEFAARVDALAVVNTARRIERVAIDLRDRLGDSHLRTALRTFANTSRQVADLRNIAEHIEEYAVGRGHLDKGEDIEPGQVIRLSVEPDDIVLAARGHSDSIGSVVEACERLASCVDAALSAHLFDLYFPEGLDFDFMVSEPDGTNRVVSELSEEQMTFKRLLADHREKEVPAQIDRGLCTTCGLKL